MKYRAKTAAMRSRRALHDMSHAALAELLGVSESTVRRIEHGEVRVDERRAAWFNSVLQVPGKASLFQPDRR